MKGNCKIWSSASQQMWNRYQRISIRKIGCCLSSVKSDNYKMYFGIQDMTYSSNWKQRPRIVSSLHLLKQSEWSLKIARRSLWIATLIFLNIWWRVRWKQVIKSPLKIFLPVAWLFDLKTTIILNKTNKFLQTRERLWILFLHTFMSKWGSW